MKTANLVIDAPARSGLPIAEVIGRAAQELRQLLQERAEIMKRIGTIKQTLLGLAQVFGDSVLDPELLTLLGRGAPRPQPGFTRACRTILMESKAPLEARQACRELQLRFPELFERHKDPVASITTVFNRLVNYSEARSSIGANGRRVWEWIGEARQVAVSDLPVPYAGPIPKRNWTVSTRQAG